MTCTRDLILMFPEVNKETKKMKIRMSHNVNSTELYIKIIIMISYMCLRYYFLPLIIIIIITVVLLVEIHNKQCEFNATILDRHGGHEEEAYTRKEICELQTWKEKKKTMMMKINKYKKKVEKKRKSLKINFCLPRDENCLNKKCLENLAKHKNKLSLEAFFYGLFSSFCLHLLLLHLGSQYTTHVVIFWN